MAGINMSAATGTLSSAAFLKSVVLIVAGSLIAQIMTEQLRANVYDVQMQGGDAIYALVASAIVLMVLPGQYGRPLALGSTATSVRVAADEFGVV